MDPAFTLARHKMLRLRIVCHISAFMSQSGSLGSDKKKQEQHIAMLSLFNACFCYFVCQIWLKKVSNKIYFKIRGLADS